MLYGKQMHTLYENITDKTAKTQNLCEMFIAKGKNHQSFLFMKKTSGFFFHEICPF